MAAVPGAFSAQRAEPMRRGAAFANAQPHASGERSADVGCREERVRRGRHGVEKEALKVARLLEEDGEEVLGVYASPEHYRKRMRTINMSNARTRN